MNRMLAAIERRKVLIAKRIEDGLTTAEKVEETRKALDLAFEEYVTFQEVKSLAFAAGMINLEEAETIYEILGESGPHAFNAAPIEVKVAMTQMLQELLNWKIKGATPPRRKAS